MSRFAIANGMESEVREAFRARPRKVDSVDGFIRMEVLSPRDAPEEIWLLTYWRDEPSFHAWHRSHLYSESHAGIPRGLKLKPGSTSIRFLDHITA